MMSHLSADVVFFCRGCGVEIEGHHWGDEYVAYITCLCCDEDINLEDYSGQLRWLSEGGSR